MKWEGGRESDRLEDRRRLGPTAAVVGGGGLIILLIGMLLGIDPAKLNRLIGNNPGAPGAGQQAEKRPPTAEEERTRKFAATILGYTEEVWGDIFQRSGKQYEKPKMVLFSNAVTTACGNAPSAVGPFYCPADKTVYLDPTFFDELEQRHGGSKAEFSQTYVIAHEIGHHVQNLLGYSGLVDQKRQTLPKSEFNKWSVRLELQADYLAGVFAHYGQKKFNFIERGDIATAIQSAQAIGDDRLQRNAGGFVSPEGFTHGSSAQREKWFRTGLETGDLSYLDKIFQMPFDEL
jgi:hypothetical protein